MNIMKSKTEKSNRKSVKPVPEGFHTVTPFLIVQQASRLMTFIEQAFDGKTTSIMSAEDGKIMHATVRIGDSEIMVADAMENFPAGTAKLYLYMDDVDSTYQQALSANGITLREPTDEFYGDRSAGVKDPWGNEWWIATHIEDVDPKEMKKRQKEFMEKAAVA
jgi:PhnB protein